MTDLMLCYCRKTLLSWTQITLPPPPPPPPFFFFSFLYSEGQYFQHTLTKPEKMCSQIKSVSKSGLLWPRLNTCGKKLVLQRPWQSSHWLSLGQEFTLLFSWYRMWRWHYILMKDTCRSTHMAVLLHFCLFNGNCLRNNMKKLWSNALLFFFFSLFTQFFWGNCFTQFPAI